MLDLLNDLKTGRTWEQVAALLGEYSPAMWMLIAAGRRHATLRQVNLVRAVYELPPLTQSPAEVVAASGVDRVIPLSKQPNTALLVAVAGDVVKVSLKTGFLLGGVAPSLSITACNVNQDKRPRRLGSSVPYMADLAILPPAAFATVRGKTGNLSTIAAAASLAAQEAP
jgi:hypothetical protein